MYAENKYTGCLGTMEQTVQNENPGTECIKVFYLLKCFIYFKSLFLILFAVSSGSVKLIFDAPYVTSDTFLLHFSRKLSVLEMFLWAFFINSEQGFLFCRK